NIYLDTGDVTIAKDIAKRIRTSSGGLPAVQASGFEVEGKAQVSMNLLDIDVTSPATVFAAVDAAARQRGVAVLKSEVVGLVPERAVLGAAAASLKLAHAGAHLLEPKIRAAEGPTLDGWLDELAGGAPVPGGRPARARCGPSAAAAGPARRRRGRQAGRPAPRAEGICRGGAPRRGGPARRRSPGRPVPPRRGLPGARDGPSRRASPPPRRA